MARDLPSGTVTFLFTDVEGSTKLLHELGAEGYADALGEHRRVLRDAFSAHGGVEVDTQGDAFFVAFPTASGALAAAEQARTAFAEGPLRVRMGIHTGRPHVTDEGYVGADVHRAARIGAAGHGGQVLVSATTAALVERDGLEELGEHRLKDFDTAVALYQLGEGAFPPLKTISNTNLPRPASSFFGREREVEEVRALLRTDARLVTLTGPGGSGKTRLAIEAAAELVSDFAAGVFWVGLAGVRDPTLVTETIAQTLGAKDGLAEHIGERELLLLVDNLEQVVVSAPELATVVEECPNLRVLVTSRELLRVRGEVEYRVLPLEQSDAAALFSARAKVEPDETVHALCRALDSLPLALELAAARASVLSPKQMLERLSERLDLLRGGRDADPRQQTLRATITWSHELLAPHERRLFACLAIFHGGCTLPAAEAVADADLDTLQSLVEKSLLRRTDERYWMLETIREYGVERLEESGDLADVRRRFVEYFVAFAEEAQPHVLVDATEWLDRVGVEHDNLRAVLDHAAATGDGERLVRVAAALWRFWYTRGFYAEGRRHLERAVLTGQGPPAARALVLNGATVMALAVGDNDGARIRAEQGLAAQRNVGDAWGIAYSVLLLGNVARVEGDFVRARDLFADSLAQFRELSDARYTHLATHVLAWMCYELDEHDRARELGEENLRLAHAMGDERAEAATLAALADVAGDDGRTDDALSMLEKSTRIWQEVGDVRALASNLCRFARLRAREGRAATAAALLACAEAQHEELGAGRSWVARINEETSAIIHRDLDERELARALDRGRALPLAAALALALDS